MINFISLYVLFFLIATQSISEGIENSFQKVSNPIRFVEISKLGKTHFAWDRIKCLFPNNSCIFEIPNEKEMVATVSPSVKEKGRVLREIPSEKEMVATVSPSVKEKGRVLRRGNKVDYDTMDEYDVEDENYSYESYETEENTEKSFTDMTRTGIVGKVDKKGGIKSGKKAKTVKGKFKNNARSVSEDYIDLLKRLQEQRIEKPVFHATAFTNARIIDLEKFMRKTNNKNKDSKYNKKIQNRQSATNIKNILTFVTRTKANAENLIQKPNRVLRRHLNPTMRRSTTLRFRPKNFNTNRKERYNLINVANLNITLPFMIKSVNGVKVRAKSEEDSVEEDSESSSEEEEEKEVATKKLKQSLEVAKNKQDSEKEEEKSEESEEDDKEDKEVGLEETDLQIEIETKPPAKQKKAKKKKEVSSEEVSSDEVVVTGKLEKEKGKKKMKMNRFAVIKNDKIEGDREYKSSNKKRKPKKKKVQKEEDSESSSEEEEVHDIKTTSAQKDLEKAKLKLAESLFGSVEKLMSSETHEQSDEFAPTTTLKPKPKKRKKRGKVYSYMQGLTRIYLDSEEDTRRKALRTDQNEKRYRTDYRFEDNTERTKKVSEDYVDWRKRMRRSRLPTFLPKRYHWKQSEYGDLGYFWFNGIQGQVPGPYKISW